MERWKRASGFLLVAGGVAWLAKLSVIVATDGRATDTGAAWLFFVTGLVLLPLGAVGAGAGLAARRGVPLRILGGLAGLVVFFFSFAVLGDVLKAAVGDRGPAYAGDEIGILVAALVWLGVGLWILARARQAKRSVTI
jgi:hypothetical protein